MTMNTPAPSFLSPFIFFTSFASMAALIFGLNRALKVANWPEHDRGRALWSGTALLAALYLAALIPAQLGFYRVSPIQIPTIQFGILIPIAIGILFFLRWPSFRRVIDAIPQQWLIGLQFYRTLGVIFLALYSVDSLPAAFAVPAGAGDVLVGLFAPLVAFSYIRKWSNANTLLRTWNLLGIADLVIAITTGFLTSPSPAQVLALDKPNLLISQYPLVMIPVFLVPLALLLHLASLQRLRHTASIPRAQRPILASERS
jgi:hypothetical protein